MAEHGTNEAHTAAAAAQIGHAQAAKSDKLKIFISYSRRDAAAADALVESLGARGFEVTIDRRDLPFGEKWQAELAESIRTSDTVIWLVSDASIRSQWVNWELDEVARRSKRLVPVMRRGCRSTRPGSQAAAPAPSRTCPTLL